MSGKLAIGNLRARCIVADGPHAAAIADRATKALRQEFPAAARRAFGGWFDRADESVWVVRRVDLSVLTAADIPTDALAASVVTALGRALGSALSNDGDGVDVIRFESRAAHLASFVSDVSSGDAWSRWYYAPLAGLKRLPVSCAIRTALTQDPSTGLQALRRLDATTLARVAAAITAQDEALILESLVEPVGEEAANEADFDAAWSECRRQLQGSNAPPSLLIGVIRGDAMVAGRSFVRALRQVRAVLEQVQAMGASRRAELEYAVGAGNHEMLIHDGPGSATSVPARILRDILAHPAAVQRTPSQLHDESSVATQFGGLFLLMRDVQELPLPELADPTLSRTLQWLTLAACAGRERAENVLHDGVFREIFGIAQSTTLREVALLLRDFEARPCGDATLARFAEEPAPQRVAGRARWLVFDRSLGLSREWSGLIALAAGRALQTFSRRLPGFADASPKYLWDNFLSADAAIDHAEDRIVVRYGRPPLHLILTITGMTRGLTVGHDPRGRPVLVFVKE